jgi:two-component system chemotaxis response regulator CheB
MSDKIKVLIVDDSSLMRKLISNFFTTAADIEVVGTAMNGRFALQKTETLTPDVIILDIEMPE